METRTIQQVKIYYLVLNHIMDMAESGRHVAFSLECENLKRFYENEHCRPYSEIIHTYYGYPQTFNKNFRKSGPLEWYNPIASLELNDGYPFGHGIRDMWINIDELEELRKNIMEV